jgi:hypothetical protein
MSDRALSREEIDYLLNGFDRDAEALSEEDGGSLPKNWRWPYPLKGPNDCFVMYPFPITGYIAEIKQK